MKALLVLVLLGVAGYFGYQRWQEKQDVVITDPVYADFKVEASAGDRNIEM